MRGVSHKSEQPINRRAHLPPVVNSVNTHIALAINNFCRTLVASAAGTSLRQNSLSDVFLSSTPVPSSLSNTVITLRLHQHRHQQQQYLLLSLPPIIMALQPQSLLLLLCIGAVCSLKVPASSTASNVTTTNSASTTPASVTISTERQHLSQVKALVVHLINSQTASPNTVGVSAVTASVKGTTSLNHNSSNSNNLLTSDTTFHSATNFSSSSLNAISSLCTDNNQTFWDHRVGDCVKCSSACPANAYVERHCNRTHDLECTCHKGWYMSVVDRTCKPCAQCPNGWGVWRTCRWSRNTVCRKCQPGTYSGSNVGTLGCIPCSKCGPNQEAITECNGNRDTICVDRATLRANFSQYFPEFAERSSISASLLNQLNAEVGLLEQDEQNRATSSVSSSSSPSYHHLHHHQHRNHISHSTKTSNTSSKGGGLSGQNALPFYFAILVIVVFSVCIYALVQLRCSEVLITGRSLEAACGDARSGSGNGVGDCASSFLATQAEQKSHLMMDNGFSGPGSAVMIPQVVTTISSPYYHGYSLSHHQPQYHHAPPYIHHYSNNTQPNYQNLTPNGQDSRHWNANTNQEQQSKQPTSFSTVMHLYTSTQQRHQQASSIQQMQHRQQPNSHHHKFNTRPTYKAYYELLFAPEDMREEEEKVKMEASVKDSATQQLPISVIDSIVEKLASDSISWKMLARQLGYNDKQVAQFERKSTPKTTTTTTANSVTSEPQQANKSKVTSADEKEARKGVIHDLLTNWCRREMMSTQNQHSSSASAVADLRWPVSTLQRALAGIGCVDCARLLQQALDGSCSSSLNTSTSSCASTSSSTSPSQGLS